jgi:parvulin-like peptidyl-prolyl isomerase
VIAEIYDRLDKGESFETLIGEYGEDPGMTDPDNLQNGYPVHRDSILWDPAFVSGAFSGKMLQVGDVSDPVVGANGIHILKYLMDIPSGLIMTDAIHEEITQYLAGARENEVYGQAFEGWMAEMDIVYHQEAIDQAIEEAAALQQSVEELPPEAVENP